MAKGFRGVPGGGGGDHSPSLARAWVREGTAKRGRVSVKRAEVETMGRLGVARGVGGALARAGRCRAGREAALRAPRRREEARSGDSAPSPHCGRNLSVARAQEARPEMKEGGASLPRAPRRGHCAARPLSQLPGVGPILQTLNQLRLQDAPDEKLRAVG